MTATPDLELRDHRLVRGGGLAWIEPAAPLAGIARIVATTRLGGGSRDAFAGLNLGAHVGDLDERVRQNRHRLAEAVRWRGEPVLAEQVHGAAVAPVGRLHAGTRWHGAEPALAGVDALFTDTAGLPLGVLAADCAPVVVADATHAVLGMAHAGWRGLAGGVIEALLAAMAATHGRGELHAWIGPCIRDCCYQIGPEAAEQLPRDARREGDGAFRLDLYAAAERRLRAAGVASVTGPALCTACHEEWLFSHRRATRAGMPATGRQAVFAWLAPPRPDDG